MCCVVLRCAVLCDFVHCLCYDAGSSCCVNDRCVMCTAKATRQTRFVQAHRVRCHTSFVRANVASAVTSVVLLLTQAAPVGGPPPPPPPPLLDELDIILVRFVFHHSFAARVHGLLMVQMRVTFGRACCRNHCKDATCIKKSLHAGP